MNLHELIKTGQKVLGDGSMYELLRRSPEVEFDTHIAHGGLIYHEQWSQVLETVMRGYIDVAIAHQRPMLTTAATWRANPERIGRSQFNDKPVNQDNALFLRRIVDSYGDANPGILVGGTLGPRGDAYKPEEALDSAAAIDFHARQVDALVEGGVDFLQAATFPALSEAVGVAQLMARTGLHYLVSFVIDSSGRLLDGTRLDEAIACIDDQVTETPASYSVNCVHPSVLLKALAANPVATKRIVAFSGNTSARSVDELDGLEELDTEAPESFAEANRALLQACNVRVIGGCCGTNPDHISAIAKLL